MTKLESVFLDVTKLKKESNSTNSVRRIVASLFSIVEYIVVVFCNLLNLAIYTT